MGSCVASWNRGTSDLANRDLVKRNLAKSLVTMVAVTAGTRSPNLDIAKSADLLRPFVPPAPTVPLSACRQE